MSAQWAVLVSLAVAAAATSSCGSERCERDCAAVDGEVQRLYERGDLLQGLALIDKVDTRCHCEQFTSGDAPPEYAWARACLRRLYTSGRGVEAEAFLAQAKGPILQELARAWADPSSRRAFE